MAITAAWWANAYAKPASGLCLERNEVESILIRLTSGSQEKEALARKRADQVSRIRNAVKIGRLIIGLAYTLQDPARGPKVKWQRNASQMSRGSATLVLPKDLPPLLIIDPFQISVGFNPQGGHNLRHSSAL